MFNPLVSIIIPVYNGSNYLREAIDSALGQDYDNLEVLVINDGSNDGGQTEQIALSYGEKIRYFSKPNGGVSSALNYGISQMHGEYFSWLSHDDKYYPKKISSQIELLSKIEDKTLIVFSGYTIIDSKGRKLHHVIPLNKYSEQKLRAPLFALLHRQIGGICLLIHKSNFERYGTFREDLKTTQDVDLWVRMMREREIHCCPGVLSMTRIHDQQVGKTSIRMHSEECNRFWISVMETLTEEEKIRLDGSVYNFYKNVYGFLSYTTYQKAIIYAKQCAYREIRKSNNGVLYICKSVELFFLGYMILAHELIISIKDNGIVNTAKRIPFAIKRLMNKFSKNNRA